MALRFQADADFNETILLAAIRREPSLDFQTASLGGIIGLTDPEVLARAAAEQRVFVTHDLRTMPRHFAEYTANSVSAGVIIVPQSMLAHSVVEDLLLLNSASEPSEWINRLVFLPV